jgi:hypothetical protein
MIVAGLEHLELGLMISPKWNWTKRGHAEEWRDMGLGCCSL